MIAMMRTPRFLILSLLLVSAVSAGRGRQVEDLGLSGPQREEKLLALLNRERVGQGLRELKANFILMEAARRHSLEMRNRRQLGHDFSGYPELADRLARLGLYFTETGENVARSETFVLRFIHDGWMANPGHRANILNAAFTDVGIGIEAGNGSYYITQEFAAPFVPAEIEDVRAAVRREVTERSPAAAANRLIYADQWEASANRQAARVLSGKATEAVAGVPGPTVTCQGTFIEVATAAKIVLDSMSKRPVYGWALGLDFGRTAQNPGGVYAMAAVLLVGEIASADEQARRPDEILRLMNAARLQSSRVALVLDPKLCGAAKRLTKTYYKGDRKAPAGTPYIAILAYRAERAEDIPPDTLAEIVREASARRAGIDVFCPAEKGLPDNSFFVVIILD